MLAEDKEQEKRRKKYKFALVRWDDDIAAQYQQKTPDYAIEHKSILGHWWQYSYTILCDDQPERVLRAMLKLLKENEE